MAKDDIKLLNKKWNDLLEKTSQSNCKNRDKNCLIIASKDKKIELKLSSAEIKNAQDKNCIKCYLKLNGESYECVLLKEDFVNYLKNKYNVSQEIEIFEKVKKEGYLEAKALYVHGSLSQNQEFYKARKKYRNACKIINCLQSQEKCMALILKYFGIKKTKK